MEIANGHPVFDLITVNEPASIKFSSQEIFDDIFEHDGVKEDTGEHILVWEESNNTIRGRVENFVSSVWKKIQRSFTYG